MIIFISHSMPAHENVVKWPKNQSNLLYFFFSLFLHFCNFSISAKPLLRKTSQIFALPPQHKLLHCKPKTKRISGTSNKTGIRVTLKCIYKYPLTAFQQCRHEQMYEDRLQSSWTHLITPSQNFVEVRWLSLFLNTSLGKRCTSYNAPPTSRKTRCGPLITSISCLGAPPFSWLEKPRNRMGRDLDCMADGLMGFHQSTFSKPNIEFNSDLTPCDFWAFPTTKRELRGKTFRSDQRSAARFREVDGAMLEVHRLPREVLPKRDRHHTSTKFRLGLIKWVYELCKRSSYLQISTYSLLTLSTWKNASKRTQRWIFSRISPHRVALCSRENLPRNACNVRINKFLHVHLLTWQLQLFQLTFYEDT
jgi:hypothetical protein